MAKKLRIEKKNFYFKLFRNLQVIYTITQTQTQ